MSQTTEPATTGDDGHSDCEVVLGRMFEFLDSELPDADSDRIRRHLVECEPCLESFDVEQAMKQLVRSCCRSETAPESLKAKIRVGLLRARDANT